MTRLVLGASLAFALAYIGWLRRELAAARSRGDMYRDLAAMDRPAAQAAPAAVPVAAPYPATDSASNRGRSRHA